MKWINAVLAGLLLLISIIYYVVTSSYKNDIVDLQNQLATATKPSIVVVGNDSTVVALTEQVKKIKAENDAVKKVLKKSDSKAKYWAEVAGSYAAELDSLQEYATTDTVFVVEGDSTTVRQFEEKLGLIDIAGNFDTKSPWAIRFTKAEIEKLRFEITLAESGDGSWRTLIHDTSPGLKLEPVISKVVPYKSPWYTKLHLNGEIRSDGGGLGLGFGNWTGMYYNNDIIGLEYSWYPFKRK
jgi:hypothetical protein